MFLIDDILLSPIKSFMMIAEKIRDAADEQFAAEARELTQQLQSLYQRLEAGEITEDEFDELEEAIIDRLDELEGIADDDVEDDDDDEEGFTVTLLDDSIDEVEEQEQDDEDDA